MPVRRLRTDHLILVPDDGSAPLTLFAETREAGDLATQDVFQASPDGGYLAYAAGGALHVRATDGSERTIRDYQRFAHMRFSPDGQYLAAVVGDPFTQRGQRIVLFEVATGTTRELAAFASVTQLEWLREAVVVHAWDQARQRDVLVALPLAGDPKTLLEHPSNDIATFVAAATGTRVVAFVTDTTATHVLALDASAPADTHELGAIHDPVTNAAASLDGERVAFTTAAALFTVTGNDKPRAISDRSSIHSLWFARDGRLGYASPTSATILDRSGAHRFDTEGPISMLRFDPVSAQALVAASANAWDVAPATPRRLATPPPGGDLLGVDHFAGGLLLWTTGDDPYVR